MTPRIEKECISRQPLDIIYHKLAELFSPRIYFHPQERFFPVDLPSSITHSSLWRVDNPSARYSSDAAHMEKDFGEIDTVQDLTVSTADHFTTVVGTDVLLRTEIGSSEHSIEMPIPRVDDVYRKYTDGSIETELTVYATVCRTYDSTNSHLIDSMYLKDREIIRAVEEGLIINYYLYFPARESNEFVSEGDWSGISLLLKNPHIVNGEIKDPQLLPVLACYFQKTIAGPFQEFASHNFVAGRHGFRRWQNIQRDIEPSTGHKTHPVVYVSRGRHNCYYEPNSSNIQLGPPWYSWISPDDIENGELKAGPVDTTISGGVDWSSISPVVYAIFPPLFFFAMCASGCESPIRFDGSGLPSGYEEGEDQTGDDGFLGSTDGVGSSYPTGQAPDVPIGQRTVNLILKYVDINNSEMAALWGYAGAWGGASMNMTTPLSDQDTQSNWGYYQGARRPLLTTWFFWNLFQDWTYGCAGKASLPSPPP